MKVKRIRAACVQLDATDNYVRNLDVALSLASKAVGQKARLIVFPENFLWRGRSEKLRVAADQSAHALSVLKEFSRSRRVYLLLGSLLEKASEKKFFNTSFLISPQGRIAARYRKIHLFDSGIKGAKVRESKHIQRGRKVVSVIIDGHRAGLSICYDLRFPELFRRLSAQGCHLFFVPANFTEITGRAHWETLLKARAVENLAFVLAPGLTGRHVESGIKSFGTSLIIDPWGNVLARGTRGGQGVILADLDFRKQARLRADFPVLKHRFFKS